MPIRIEKDDDTEDNGGQDSGGTGGTAYTVRHGDTLGSIAKQYYGDSSKYKLIFEANRNVWEQHGLTPNANLIKVGWELIIPSADDSSADATDEDDSDDTTTDDTTDTTNDDDTSDDDTTKDDTQTDDNDNNSDDGNN